MHHVTMGVAAGDGDLMPPRFASDRHTNTSDWVRDFTYDIMSLLAFADERKFLTACQCM